MSNLIKLFNELVKKACENNAKNENFDGLKYWRQMKSDLEKLDKIIVAKKWKLPKESTRKRIMKIPEYDSKKNIIRFSHFLIQQVRIPYTSKPSIRKILQLALNIGQMKGLVRHIPVYNEILNCISYKKLKLDKLEYYLPKSEIVRLSKLIDKKLLNQLLQKM
jgi:hypothetical protein